jgi:hypothetical protein
VGRKPNSPKTSKVLRNHVRRRALERFGLQITTEDIEELNKSIQQNRARFVDRQSNNVTRWVVPLKDISVGVAYDKQRKCIRTVMPVEYLTTSRISEEIKKLMEEDIGT